LLGVRERDEGTVAGKLIRRCPVIMRTDAMGSGGGELEILLMANLAATEERVTLAFARHNAVFGSVVPNHCYRE